MKPAAGRRLPAALFVLPALLGCPEAEGLRQAAAAKAGPPDAWWIPGDDVPGWEDYDCPEAGASPLEIQLHWPSTFAATAGFWAQSPAPVAFNFLFADCVENPCPSTGRYDVYAQIYFEASEELWPARGMGWYSTEDGNFVWAIFDSVVRYMETWVYPETTDTTLVKVDLCMSRVRPDQLSGILYIDGGFENEAYGSHYYSYAFEVLVPPGGGIAADGDPTCPDPTFGAGTMGVAWWYEALLGPGEPVLYDTVWPWEEITDPDVATRLYDAYYPCGGLR